MILDSGDRTQFSSGAVRDMKGGKGRCDLLPLGQMIGIVEKLDACEDAMTVGKVLRSIRVALIQEDGSQFLDAALEFIDYVYSGNVYASILDLSIHFEEGAQKYGEGNWKKGIPIQSYVDSGLRHLFKYFAGYRDEPHDRAFIWNMVCAAWTASQKPELWEADSNVSKNEDN